MCMCVCVVCLPVACFVVACQSAHITRRGGESKERGMETRRRKRKQLHKWLTTTTTTAAGRLPVSCSGLCRLGGCRAEIVFFLFPSPPPSLYCILLINDKGSFSFWRTMPMCVPSCGCVCMSVRVRSGGGGVSTTCVTQEGVSGRVSEREQIRRSFPVAPLWAGLRPTTGA